MIAHSAVQSSTRIHYLQCYFLHEHLNNAWYNKANPLIDRSYLELLANDDFYDISPILF